MQYRRYGKTELQMPVLTCGGMRYQASWNGDETDKITDDGQANLAACLARAVELGINHIETARGYGTSEEQIGRAMSDLPREKIILQTKLGPTETGEEFADWFEQSLRRLRTDHVELLSIHGINNQECFDQTVAPGGPLDVAETLKAQGRVDHIGFSTHGPCEIILKAIETGRFDYVNLHWYWIFRSNWPAVEAATKRDMGVFIISPNDKGGKLYEPPARLKELCDPLSPMEFNDLWCLHRRQVHTLSIGVSKPDDFDDHMRAIERLNDPQTPKLVQQIDQRLNQRAVEVLGKQWWSDWAVGLPDWDQTPGSVNLRVILMLYNLGKAFDMIEYGQMRYNLLGNAGHWFPGEKLSALDDVETLRPALADHPMPDQVIAAMNEAHEMFKGEEVKRLQKE